MKPSAYRTLSVERLYELFDLDLDTGVLRWKYRPECPKKWNTRFAGKIAGCTTPGTYTRICVDYMGSIGAHRIVWAMVNGCWPPDEVDHKNGVVHDNCPSNLRKATRAENSQNLKPRSNNKSGYPGVSWSTSRKKWCAYIMINKKRMNLGRYDTPDEASAAYLAAKAKLHPFQPEPRLSAGIGLTGC